MTKKFSVVYSVAFVSKSLFYKHKISLLGLMKVISIVNEIYHYIYTWEKNNFLEKIGKLKNIKDIIID